MNRYRHHIDLRRVRSQRLTAAIIQEIIPLIGHNKGSEIHRAVHELLWRSGVEVITDIDRHEADLPARNNLGYTPDELRALEARRIEIMLNPNTNFAQQLDTVPTGASVKMALLVATDMLEELRRGHGVEVGAKCIDALNRIRPVVEAMV